MITQSCDADISDGSLELDERMSSVVWVRWTSLTAGTEVGIVADSALISVSLDKGLHSTTRIAERTIAIDAVVASLGSVGSRQNRKIVERFVDGDKSVARVDEASVGVASRAKVPIWAVEALVADAVYVFVTSITDSIVASVAAWGEKSLGNQVKVGIFNSWLESMLGIVAMLHAYVARDAQIVVWACSASNEVLLGEFCKRN